MRNPASVREEERKGNSNTINHGEFDLKHYSLWFIVFTGVVLFLATSFAFAYAEVERVTLENGMTVLLKENHNRPLVDLFLCVGAGSAREGEFSGCGISHFIEHMLFKGTSTHKAGEIFRKIESYGGKINGFTSYDYTGYNITVPAEFAFLALELLADMTFNATFDEQELEKERQVILKEIRLNYDNPRRYAARTLWQTAYSTHPYKYPIIGQEHLFNSLTRKDLLEFYQAVYVPNNMILAVVGDIEPQTFLVFIKKFFKDSRRKSIADFDTAAEPEQDRLRTYEEKFTAGMTYLSFGFHGVAMTDEDCFALDVLGAILGEGESSRLYKSICNRRKLAYSIEAINYTPRDPGLFIISCFLEEKHRQRVQSLIFKQIELIKKKKISEDELESAKNKIISDILFQRQTIEAQAQELALNEVLCADFNFTEKYIKEIKQVDSRDILRVANKYLVQKNLNIVALTPRDKSISSGSFKKANPIKKYVLANGPTLLVRENRDLPLISIKAVFKGGLRAENRNINGLCNLVAQMLDKGTGNKDAEEIAYLVESKGARLSCFSGNNSFGLSLDLLSKDFDQMLELLSDLIINSTFPQKEFERQKEKNLAELKATEDNIFESGTKLLKATLFQKHPYRFLTIGNEESLKNLTRRDLVTFYQNFCVGRNMVLAVFGDVDAEKVLERMKEFFAEFAPGDFVHFTAPQETPVKTVRTSSKTLPKQQSLIMMGFYGTTVFNQDRYAIEMICQVLSQPSGRLFTQIREKRGLAYTLGAYSVLGLDPGYIVIYVATLSENIEIVKEKILQQVSLFKQRPLSEEELLQAKRALLAKKLIDYQTNSACALESSLDELYGLGYNHHLEYFDRINQVAFGDITRCAKQYFDLNNYAIVVVGPT